MDIEISLDKTFEIVEHQMMLSGIDASKSLDTIKTRFLKCDEKITSSMLSVSNQIQTHILEGIGEFNVKVGNGPNPQNCENQIPAKLVFGVTVALVGVLLMTLPFSALGIGTVGGMAIETWGSTMFISGTVAAADCLCEGFDSQNAQTHANHNNQMLLKMIKSLF